MRKQDRIASQQQQNRPKEPLRKDAPPQAREQEQSKAPPLPNRPQRQPGKLPLPD